MTPKLLLADDSVTIQRVIELTFADEDVQVLAVGDGRQAIERVQADRPDIVLADIGMPERDGYEVAAFIKADPALAHIPVLLLTGAFEPVDEVRARAVGCDGVLVKPFEPQMVISRVRDLLAGHRTTDLSTKPVTAAPVTITPDERPHAAGAMSQTPGASLEDYFDRLDAALASKTVPPPPQYAELTPVPFPSPGRPPSAAAPAVRSPEPVPAAPPQSPASMRSHIKAVESPTLTEPGPVLDLGNWDPGKPDEPEPATSSPVRPAPAPPEVVPDTIAQAPSLQDAFAALLAAEQNQPIASPRLDPDSNALIEEVARRVIARLGNETMRAAVLDAAERLVREEIARIKSQT